MERTEKIRVGISDYKWSKAPDAISTIGLGSCVGIAIFDEKRGLGGLNHIMLPTANGYRKEVKVAKFADLALPALVQELLALGARRSALKAKIAGGASMFHTPKMNGATPIGDRNVQAVLETLEALKIPLLSHDVGGDKGRTMTLYLADMRVTIKKAGEKEFII